MVRPHLVESSYCKTLVPLKGGQILHHFLHKNIFPSCCYIRENSKNNEAYQKFLRDNVTLIHHMNYKYETFIDEILQCLVNDKLPKYLEFHSPYIFRKHFNFSAKLVKKQ